MLIGILGASLLGYILDGKWINKKDRGIKRTGEGFLRAGYGNKSNNIDFKCHLIF